MDEIDVDSIFYHNSFGNSQSHHRRVRVSKGSIKKSFAIRLFEFCDLKTQQRYIQQEEVIFPKRELRSLVNSLRDFLKSFDKASKYLQNLPQKPENETGSKKSEDKLFARYYRYITEHQDFRSEFVHLSDLKTTTPVFSQTKSLN